MDGALDAPVISRENSSHEMYLIVYIAITIMKGDLCAVRCVTSCFITLFAQPQATAFLVTLEPKYKVMPVPHNPKDVPIPQHAGAHQRSIPYLRNRILYHV